MKAASDQALSIGWYSVVFARQQNLKPLNEYLNPPTKAERRARFIAKFRSLKHMKGAAHGTG